MAFRRPSPLHNYSKVNVGDVGYVRDGRFQLLFNAVDPGTQPTPAGFVPMRSVAITPDPPLAPGALHWGTVLRRGIAFGVQPEMCEETALALVL